MVYNILVEETVSEIFRIEGDNPEQALKIARQKYRNKEIVLEPGNLIECKITLVDEDAVG